MFAMPPDRVFLIRLNVSSGFPFKKISFPRNLCSLSLIEDISLSPKWNIFASGRPPDSESDVHLEGKGSFPLKKSVCGCHLSCSGELFCVS